MILGCSGSRPPPDPGIPTLLPPPPGDPGHPGPVQHPVSRSEPAGRRWETVRLVPAEEGDALSRGGGALGRLVDLELARTPIRDAFRLLADAAGINVVVVDEVDGEVTLRLRRIAVRDALRAVAAAVRAELEWDGAVLLVRAP